jgi:hypothetical protein
MMFRSDRASLPMMPNANDEDATGATFIGSMPTKDITVDQQMATNSDTTLMGKKHDHWQCAF